MTDQLPVFAICGWSGSGKTTLIEQVLPLLIEKGLKVAVVKHDAHGIDVDRPGKDSDRFFQAGADVLLEGPKEKFFRTHHGDGGELEPILLSLAASYDFVLVEGHKGTPLTKVWIAGENETVPPPGVTDVVAVLPAGPGRLTAIMSLVEDFLKGRWMKTPVFGCIVPSGTRNRTDADSLKQTVVLLRGFCVKVVVVGACHGQESAGAHALLSGVPDVDGPLAGVLAAMRWAPRASWLVADHACDLSQEIVRRLLAARAPGVWAVVAKGKGSDIGMPPLAHYDFRCRPLLEQMALVGGFSLDGLASHPKVAMLDVSSENTAERRKTWVTGQ